MLLHRKSVSIRPQQPWFWLVVAALLLAGALAAGNLYERGVWLFGAIFVALVIGFARDRLVFNGETIRRRGPGAWLSRLLLGHKQELTLEELETISSYLERQRRRDGRLIYRTIISGAGVRWEIKSTRTNYRNFIKRLFRLTSASKLDPRSCLLRDYWQESCLVKQKTTGKDSSPTNVPPQLWRGMANHLALEGKFDSAARYFRLARRREPGNARLVYELGRFLQLRAMLESRPAEIRRRTPRGMSLQASCVRRSEACFRLAGWLARHDASLLERIGESYFETHDDEMAERYFVRSLNLKETCLRSNIGMAEVAFRSNRLAHVIHFYRSAAQRVEHEADQSLGQLADRRADYYERLRRDDRFLDAEVSRLNMLDHLKWARRGALLTFLLSWFVHLAFHNLAESVQVISREISATAAIIWLSTLAATYLFSQRRN